MAAQFFNAAAQGGTWAFFINYGVEKMGLSAERAAYFFAASMVLMMVGRFIGTALVRVVAPARLLAIAAAANIGLCLLIAQAGAPGRSGRCCCSISSSASCSRPSSA